MNNLEICLYELELLVTYGIMALKAMSVPNAEDMRGWGADDICDYFGLRDGDLVEYLKNSYSHCLVFDGFDEAWEYVSDNLDKNDLKEYLYNNYDPEDMLDISWRTW